MSDTAVSVAGFESDYGSWEGFDYAEDAWAGLGSDGSGDLPKTSGTGLLEKPGIFLDGPAPPADFDPTGPLRDGSSVTVGDSMNGLELSFVDGSNSSVIPILDARDAQAQRGVRVLSTNPAAGGAAGVNRNGIARKPPSTVNTTGGVLGFVSGTLRDIGTAARGIASAQTRANAGAPNLRTKPTTQLLDNQRQDTARNTLPVVPIAALAALILLS